VGKPRSLWSAGGLALCLEGDAALCRGVMVSVFDRTLFLEGFQCSSLAVARGVPLIGCSGMCAPLIVGLAGRCY
jgi:hypothetical protein